MEISSFDDLLQAARSQPEPQRLLFVFAGVELPDDATPEQRTRFAQGEGGALVPQMCVDKTPEELGSFDALVNEAAQFGKEWTLVFAAGLSGTLNRAPTSEDAEAPLERIV
ncbi:MAG: ribonucleotide reductase subunit alpha, partial [Giesbergeria sp.]